MADILTQDNAETQLVDTPNSPPSSVVGATALSASEQQNLSPSFAGGYYGDQTEQANGGYDPSIGSPVATGASPNEAALGESVPGQAALTQNLNIAPNYNTPNAANVANPNPDTISTAPIPNRLHNYPSYIYGLSWHTMTPKEFNLVVETQKYSPANVLIASAGRWTQGVSSAFPRNPFFSEDFYFENFTMESTVAPGPVNRNTNVLQFEFTIIEPYGFTLVERILRMADAMQVQNYKDLPHMLQIDFYAIDNAGNLQGSIDALKKRVPWRLLQMDIKVTTKGTEYHIKGAPYPHSAYDADSVSTPTNFEVTATTVGEFFQSVADSATDASISAAQSATQRETANTAASSTPATTSYTSVNSYGTAINSWFTQLQKNNKIGVADVYRFQFVGDEISTASFNTALTNTPKDAPMSSDQISMAKSNQKGSSQGIYDPTKAIFQVQSGTTIEKLLEYVIRSSDYIEKQLIVPEDPTYAAKKAELANKPLKWFKIVPTIRMLGFDNIRNIYAREITYSIQTYTIYNLWSTVGPQGTTKNPVKVYNYMYTGLNDDVLDLDMQFNALYYNQVTAYRDNQSTIAPTAQQAQTDTETANAPNYTGPNGEIGPNFKNTLQPVVQKPVVQNSKAAATGGSTTPKQVASLDLSDSLMTGSKADMLNLKLKIIGDPDYIKQDDCFYNPPLPGTNIATVPSKDPRLLPGNGSLVMDAGPVYVEVNFKVPVDIDESTGFMKYDNGYHQSIFSGLYKVLVVTSMFQGGQFTQELELVREPRQDTATTSTNRQPLTPQAHVGIQPPAPIPSILVSGGAPAPSDASQADANSGNQVPGQQATTASPTVGPDYSGGYYGDQVEEGGGGYMPGQQDLMALNNTAPSETITEQDAPDFTPISVAGNKLPGAAAIT